MDLGRLERSIAFLTGSGLTHEFRSTIWPAWHGPEELQAMAQALKGAQAWTLQSLRPDSAWDAPALGPGRPYSAQELGLLQRTLADPVTARGQRP